MAYNMDDHTPTLNPNNPQTVIQITNEPIIANKTEKTKKPSTVPNIIIASKNSPGSSSRNLMKTRVESNKELKGHIKKTQDTQRTARNTPPVRRAAQKIDNEDQEPDAFLANDLSITRAKKSFLPQSMDTLAGKKLDQHKKMYTEREVWSFIESCNPVLHEFGKKHNLELEDLEVFAACIEELEINPQLFIEHIHASNQPMQKSRMQQVIDSVLGDPHEQNLDYLHKQYAKMQREKPEDYKALLLELMKTVADQEEGRQANRSTIADTHTALQNQEIANQARQNQMTLAGFIVAVFTAVPGWATSIWQFTSPANCTN